jgi:lysozyme family protein
VTVDLDAMKACNLARWNAMQVRPGRVAEADRVVRRLIGNWTQYVMIGAACNNVPPGVIACIHERESSGAIAHLANGDSLRARTVHVPRGGIPAPAQPPFGFAEAGVWAIKIVDHLDTWGDWSIAGSIMALIKYNGLYYDTHGLPSPYMWAGSNQYGPPEAPAGKFPEDGRFDPTMVDQQLGCAVLIARLAAAGADTGISGIVAGDGHDHPTSRPTTAKATLPAQEHTTRGLQDALNKLGINPQLTVDDDYGKATTRAVRAFQEQAGILDDGKAGPVTWREIESRLSSLENGSDQAAAKPTV